MNPNCACCLGEDPSDEHEIQHPAQQQPDPGVQPGHGLADLPHVRSALAVSLFRSGDISAATAAKVAQVPLADMLSLLSGMGIPLYGGSPADAVQEMESGAQWLAPKS
jgi:predicted HTH domain antitoxin